MRPNQARLVGRSVRTLGTDAEYGRSVRMLGTYGRSVRALGTDAWYGRSVSTLGTLRAQTGNGPNLSVVNPTDRICQVNKIGVAIWQDIHLLVSRSQSDQIGLPI